MLCHYYGREAALELREDIETVLEPGMVVSMEPMSSENLTGFPYGPAQNIVGA